MSKKKVFTNWLDLPPDFSPEDWAGFVYLIVNTLTDQKYVGKKFFWSKRKTKVKGQKRRKIVVSESDWRTYKSSSDDVKADIKKYGLENFKFYVLSLHKTRAETNYTEIKEQFCRDVLYDRFPNGSFVYYNECILNRYYRRHK